MTPLRRRMLEDLQLRGLAPKTQAIYVHAVQQLAEHYGTSPDQITEEELRQYFLYLHTEKHAAPRLLRHGATHAAAPWSTETHRHHKTPGAPCSMPARHAVAQRPHGRRCRPSSALDEPLVQFQASFSGFRHLSIALVRARHNLQSTICNLQLH